MEIIKLVKWLDRCGNRYGWRDQMIKEVIKYETAEEAWLNLSDSTQMLKLLEDVNYDNKHKLIEYCLFCAENIYKILKDERCKKTIEYVKSCFMSNKGMDLDYFDKIIDKSYIAAIEFDNSNIYHDYWGTGTGPREDEYHCANWTAALLPKIYLCDIKTEEFWDILMKINYYSVKAIILKEIEWPNEYPESIDYFYIKTAKIIRKKYAEKLAVIILPEIRAIFELKRRNEYSSTQASGYLNQS